MVQSTPAPKVRYPKMLFVAYIYAAILAALAIVQLMGVGGFDLAGIMYQTPGLPAMIVIVAGLEIFALPFLLRLPLSRLARFFSALFALVVPFVLLAHTIYLMNESMMATNTAIIALSAAFIPVGLVSFYVLGGQAALSMAIVAKRKK